MTLPDRASLREAFEVTWPAAHALRSGPWTLRDGLGGGKRASAATAEGPVAPGDLAHLEAWSEKTGAPPLVLVRTAETALDDVLAEAGYALIDPVVIYLAPVARLGRPPRLTAFPLWPPLAVMDEIWAEGGIGPARRAVMERVRGPKAALLARIDDRAAGAGFVAAAAGIAMVHALHVRPDFRRRGAARFMLAGAAAWAEAQGARDLGLAVTRDNTAANALYLSLGMVPVEHYHYRIGARP